MLKRLALTALALVAGASTGLLRAFVGPLDEPDEDERQRWAQLGADAATSVLQGRVTAAYLAGYADAKAEGKGVEQ